MGCCKSKNDLNKTHPECDLGSKFDGIAIGENENNKNTEPMSEKLHKFIHRQSKFESSLKKEYESRDEFEFCPFTNNGRVIKPFLSSTFRDFNEEREYLMADCFPLIEKKCNEKGLHFAPIDLRWGVTANQCNSGQVIKICLDEIDECRPYFLCFLGFRNGWSLCNGNKNDTLLLKTFDFAAKFCEYEWIYKNKQKSVTELEILYGAFMKKEKFPHLRCIFYIKSVDYLKQQIETRQDAHSQFIDFDEAETNLMDLKTKIIHSKECKVRWFSSCQELGTLIKADLSNVIESDFPPINEQSDNPHKIFCNLMTNKVYIDINQIQSKLNKFLFKNNTKNLCIIYGDFGIGKTSVLANFDKNQRKKSKKCLVISRFIGITNESVSICALLKGVLNELYNNEKFIHLKEEVEDEQDQNEIAEHLFDLLAKIQSIFNHDRILLIFDAINHLLNNQQLQFVNLLQQNNTNPKIKIILSTSSMNMNVFRQSNVEQIKLSAMSKDEILIFIKHYLSQYGKVFDESQKAQIIHRFDEKTVANPLFLSIFLEEMRSFGSFEQLNEYIASYICADSICELFEKVMNRLNKEFCEENDILKHALCLLHVSRNGLLPNELQLCLEQTLNVSKMEKTFPVFAYSSLIHQLTNLHFIRQINGKYAIIHQFIKDAICSKYFAESQNFKFYQLAIYKTFIQIYSEDDYANDSFINQVPYSLSILISDFGQIQFCENLINIISDIECIKYMKLPQNIYDFDKYFALTQLSIYDCFKAKFEELIKENTNNQYSDNQIAAYFHDLAIFMIDTGRYQQCEYFLLESLHFYDGNALQTELITFELAKLYQRQFRFAESMRAYKECIRILGESEENKLKLLIRQSGLGGIYKELNRWNDAIETFEACLEQKIKILNDEHPLVAIDMINIANVYVSSHQSVYIDKAHNLAISAKQIFEMNFGADCLQLSTVYSLHANIHSFKNENNAAIKCLENAKDIKLCKLGTNNVEIVQCFNNLGAVYLKMNDMKNAKISFDKALDLALSNENEQKLILCHRNLSNYHLLNEQYDKALSHLIDSKDLIQGIFGDNHIKLIQPLLSLAEIYNERIKDYERAKSFFDKVLNILDETGLRDDNARMQCFNGLSILYLRHYKVYEKSIQYLDKQMDIISDEDKMKKNDILHDKVAVYLAQNDHVSAWSILKQILSNFEEAKEENIVNESLISTYNLCGNVMFELNRQNEAIDFYEKELKLIKITNKSDKKRTSELIQLLAIFHFGNQNLEQSKIYFELYAKETNDSANKDTNTWINDIKQAEMLLCA